MERNNEGCALTIQIFRFFLLFIATVTLGVSCGGKSSSGAGGGASGNPNYSGDPYSAQIATIRQQLCPAGLPPIVFSTPTNTTMTTLNGPFSPGSIYGQGVVGAVYVGTSAFGDLMIVRKILNGATPVGFDIEMDMCPFPPLVIAGRPISGFQSNGITLMQDNNCNIGNVSYAMTIMQADAYQNLQPAPVQTAFAPVYNKPCGSGSTGGGGYYGY